MDDLLDIRSVRTLSTVSRAGGFTAAARRLGITQATVSQRIAALESTVGATLIDRKSKAPTVAGRILIEYGDRAVLELRAATSALDELLGLETGRLRIGIINLVGFFDLSSALSTFHEHHPGVDISLTSARADKMLSALEHGHLDLVIANTAPREPIPSGCDRALIGEEDLVVVLPAEAGRDQVDDVFAGRTLATFPSGSALRSTVDEALRELGAAPRVGFEADRPEVLEGLVRNGLAATIVPHSVTASWDSSLRTDTPQIDTKRRVSLTWSISGGMSPSANAFRRIILDQLASR